MPSRIALYTAIILITFQTVYAAGDATRWPAWRGADGSGIAHRGNPPLQWSETENIKWKTDLPGEGTSTPIIWDDKIFLQAAEALGADSDDELPVYRFIVLCVSRSNGKILWQTKVREQRPHQGHHETGSMAPASPVTDGKHVWASFGSRGLYCLDMNGNVVWEAETVKMKKNGRFGEGSSPVLVDNAVIVLADHEGQSKLFAFHRDTGKIIWERDREEESSWNTPAVATVGDRTEIIATAPGSIRSYDAATGNPIWNCGGLTSCAAPSPVVSGGLVYCTTGYKGSVVMAVELGHTGDLTGTDAVKWSVDSTGSEAPTPLVYENRIYVFRAFKPVLSCFNATTGEPYYERQRISGMKNVYASPLAVGKHIYICGREGLTTVINSADTYEVVATNKLDDTLDGSPVAIGDELYLRGRSNLYCIAAN